MTAIRCWFTRPDNHGGMAKSADDKQIARHVKEVVRLETTIEAYKAEVRRLARTVERAEEEAAKWRRKAKKLKKRESTVIVEAAPELASLPETGDALSA